MSNKTIKNKNFKKQKTKKNKKQLLAKECLFDVSIQIKEFIKNFNIDANKFFTKYPLNVKNARNFTLKQQIFRNLKYNDVISKDFNIDYNYKNQSRNLKVYMMQPINIIDSQTVFFLLHSGGMVIGGWPYERRLFHDICISSQMIGYYINYSLAPENKYPIQLYDCINSINQLHRKNKFKNIILISSSAGGLIVPNICKNSHLLNCKIKLQILLWPHVSLLTNSCSYKLFKTGYFLNMKDIIFFNKEFYSNLKYNDFPVNFSNKILSKMPPTIIVVNGHDVLRDEGKKYYELLNKNKVDVVLLEYPSMIHDFAVNDKLSYLPSTKHLVASIGAQMKLKL
jgi:acetyl esterase